MKSKLPAVPIAAQLHAAGTEGGDLKHQVAPLDPFVYRDMRWCANCAGPQLFVQCFECEAGRVGFCFGCNEERVIPWSRATEAA